MVNQAKAPRPHRVRLMIIQRPKLFREYLYIFLVIFKPDIIIIHKPYCFIEVLTSLTGRNCVDRTPCRSKDVVPPGRSLKFLHILS